jgi:hypothetical protein
MREPVLIPYPVAAGLLVALVVVFLGGWALLRSNGATAASVSRAPLGLIPSTAATGTVQLTLGVTPDPPHSGPTTLTIHAQDATGQPVSGVQVQWSMDMTNMSMGRQTGQMTDLGGGNYQAQANFEMWGPWRLNVAVTQAGQVLGSGYFDLQIR